MNDLFALIKDINSTDKIIDLISDGEYDLNMRDASNNYLLTYAIVQNNKKLVSELLKHDIKLDIFDNDGRSILYDSIRFGYIDLLKLLLDKNASLVGINILDMLDKRGLAPLHYVIQFKNVEILDLFMNYDFNINITNIINEYPIHLAISSMNVELTKKLIMYGADINVLLRTGENCLHLATNFNLTEIALLLIDKGININKRDIIYDYPVIQYAISSNNTVIFKKLVDQGDKLDINGQDYVGYTPLHYICETLHYKFLSILLSNKAVLNKLNFNLYSYNKEIPFMLLLKSIDNDSDYDYEFIRIFVTNTNLNFSNLHGETCLFYLISVDRWRQFRDILKTKKLNVFIRPKVDGNVSNKRIIDYIKKDDFEDFINLLTDSYYYQLSLHKDVEWREEWENKCKDKLTDSSACKDIIRRKLLKLYNLKKSDSYCHINLSYPVKKTTSSCPLVKEYEDIEFCTFAGVNMDIIFGMLYLFKKHSNICSPIQKVTYHHPTEQINLEMKWDNKLTIDDNFIHNFNKCVNKSKRFIIIPLGIEVTHRHHANYLLYDSKVGEIERFEPYGSYGPTEFNYNRDMLDITLSKFFEQINVKYVSPKEYLPKVGFQFFEQNETKKLGDPNGFCAVWSVWYVDQRLTYNNIRRDKLIKKLIKEISYRHIAYKDLIRNYSYVITSIRDHTFNKVNININKWISDSYTIENINDLLAEVNKQYLNNQYHNNEIE